MTWVKKVERPGVCCNDNLPALSWRDMNEYWAGSEWQCPVCFEFWVIVKWVTAGGSQDYVPIWRMIDED